MSKERSRWFPSPAMAVALAALFVALAGTSYAAFALAPNSVGTAQLQNRAVTATKVALHSLTGSNINLSKLGLVPSARYAIATGVLQNLTFEHLDYVDPPGTAHGAELPCGTNETAIGGGIQNSDPQADVYVNAPYSTTTGFGPGGTANAWYFDTFNHDSSGTDNVEVWTLCFATRGPTGF